MEAATEMIDPSGGCGSGIDLRITVRDADGKIVNEQCKEGDLYTLNWVALIAEMFRYGLTSAVKSYQAFNVSGSQVMLGTFCYNADQWRGSGRCDLGSSTQTPTIRDFAASVFVKSCTPSAPQLSSSGNTLKVIVPATASFTSETIISEASMVVTRPIPSSDLLTVTHDTFTPVTVPAGGSLTIQFELWFNAMPS